MHKVSLSVIIALSFIFLQFPNSSFLYVSNHGRALAEDKPKPAKKKPEPDSVAYKKYRNFFTYYYKNPQPKMVIKVLQDISKDQITKKNKSSIPILSAFFSHIIHQNTDLLPDWEPHFRSLPTPYRYLIAQAMWWSNAQSAMSIVENYAKNDPQKELFGKIIKKPPLDLKLIRVTHPIILDMLWSSFMATGDTDYVDRIIGALANYKKPATNKDSKTYKSNGIQQWIMMESAIWSLGANAYNHDLVYQRLLFYAKSGNPVIRNTVAGILEKVDKRKAAKKTG